MKINWYKSLSFRINSGMLLILITLFAMSGLSLWMTSTYNKLSAQVSNELIPQLTHSSDLHLAIKYVHRKMDALPRSISTANNRVIVTELMAELNKISLAVDFVIQDKYRQSLVQMTSQLLPIVNAYSFEVTQNLQIQKDLQRNKKILDDIYLSQIQIINLPIEVKEKLHRLYVLARSLSDITTSYSLKKSIKEILKINKNLRELNVVNSQFYNIISHREQGIIALLRQKNEIAVNLSVLNTQTNVIVEQLISISLAKMTELEELVSAATIKLKQQSAKFTNLITSIVLLTTIFTLALMRYFHKKVSRRLMTIASSLGQQGNQKTLENETLGVSEISIIAKSILNYRAHSEQQRDKIASSVNQLKFILENSSQAVIIYREDSIVYCNRYCQEVLDIDAGANNNIISQNLLMAIDDKTYIDRLKVGGAYFRFFATDIEWDGSFSTLALLIDITNEVNKEKQLIKNLETVKDESFIDALTGLYNRRKLESFMDQQFATQYALIVADIDWFKAFNDHYGHAEGDVCITKVAMAIKESLRTEDDIAVRYGGEEFLILLVESTLAQAESVAERIQSIIIKFAIKHEKSEFDYLSLSLGVAHSTEFEEGNWQELFKIADQRLYQAKASGRACTVSKGNQSSLGL